MLIILYKTPLFQIFLTIHVAALLCYIGTIYDIKNQWERQRIWCYNERNNIHGDLIDTRRKSLWLGYISRHEWTQDCADTQVVAFVLCKTITYSQRANNTAQTSDSINDIVAKKPCNWNIEIRITVTLNDVKWWRQKERMVQRWSPGCLEQSGRGGLNSRAIENDEKIYCCFWRQLLSLKDI